MPTLSLLTFRKGPTLLMPPEPLISKSGDAVTTVAYFHQTKWPLKSLDILGKGLDF